MPTDALFARELRDRELAEPAEARAARTGYATWTTYLRVWAAAARAGLSEDGDIADFIATRLWPDLPAAWRRRFVQVVRTRAAEGHPLVRPAAAEDVVGERVAALMRAHGYPTGDAP
jgi:hypothetical protein